MDQPLLFYHAVSVLWQHLRQSPAKASYVTHIQTAKQINNA